MMSTQSNKTEYKVIQILEKCLLLLEDTHNMKITKIDDFEISLAKNMIKSIIENNEPTMDIGPPFFDLK